MPWEEFQLRSAIWWMAQNYAAQLKQDRAIAQDALERNALERKWMVIFAAKLVLERSFGKNNYKNILRKYYQGEWSTGKEPAGRWFEQIYDKAKKSVVYVYKESAKKTDFVHRNWMRSPATIESLRTFVLEAPFIEMQPPGS